MVALGLRNGGFQDMFPMITSRKERILHACYVNLDTLETGENALVPHCHPVEFICPI